MDEFVFELLRLTIMVLGVVVTYRLIPWIKSKTTEQQRQEATYWISLAVKVAEQIYADKGQGVLKKEYVLKWLNDNGIKISESQANILIDLIVDIYNKAEWKLETAETEIRLLMM